MRGAASERTQFRAHKMSWPALRVPGLSALAQPLYSPTFGEEGVFSKVHIEHPS